MSGLHQGHKSAHHRKHPHEALPHKGGISRRGSPPISSRCHHHARGTEVMRCHAISFWNCHFPHKGGARVEEGRRPETSSIPFVQRCGMTRWVTSVLCIYFPTYTGSWTNLVNTNPPSRTEYHGRPPAEPKTCLCWSWTIVMCTVIFCRISVYLTYNLCLIILLWYCRYLWFRDAAASKMTIISVPLCTCANDNKFDLFWRWTLQNKLNGQFVKEVAFWLFTIKYSQAQSSFKKCHKLLKEAGCVAVNQSESQTQS